jgi:hypothetical protein
MPAWEANSANNGCKSAEGEDACPSAGKDRTTSGSAGVEVGTGVSVLVGNEVVVDTGVAVPTFPGRNLLHPTSANPKNTKTQIGKKRRRIKDIAKRFIPRTFKFQGSRKASILDD